MKKKGLILLFAGVFVILAGIALYGIVGLGESGFTYADFVTKYGQLASAGQLNQLASNTALENFFIRYFVLFAIAAAVVLAGGIATIILTSRAPKKVKA